ncbi:MAG: hypothetical protein RSA54_13925, partial [Glutamicibacter sp.]
MDAQRPRKASIEAFRGPWQRCGSGSAGLDGQHRMLCLQQDSLGFAQSLSAAVEQGYQWKSDRGLAIVKTAIVSIEY